MHNVKALAVLAQGTTPVPNTIERREPLDDEVEIDILYCGVCHSDLHQANGAWGTPPFPLVPGHEIVGLVKRAGPAVKHLSVGQTVGVGCVVDSCRTCPACETTDVQFCPKIVLTYASPDPLQGGAITKGGYSESIVVPARNVLTIPASLDPAGAAPLLCAGTTVYDPIMRANVKPGMKVGVVGLGGLGHIAVKIMKALGADVYVFSRSAEKGADGHRLGAKGVVVSTDEKDVAAHAGTFDFILDTVPVDHDLSVSLSQLRRHGTLAFVGHLGKFEKYPINGAQLIAGGLSLVGGLICGIKATQEMLDFCGKHGIVSDIELIKATAADLKMAFERVAVADVKYRFVIDLKTIE